MLSFYLYGYATDHQDYLVGLFGYVLVHPTLKVSKFALDGVVAHTTTANLISYENIGGIMGSKLVEF